MIQEIVKIWDTRKTAIRNNIKSELVHNNNLNNYLDLVTIVIRQLQDGGLSINPNKITEIDDGDYQGTLLYLIPVDSYQPSDYYYLKMNYGSCSMCDTFQFIRCEHDVDTQIEKFMMLALNIIQELKLLEGDSI